MDWRDPNVIRREFAKYGVPCRGDNPVEIEWAFQRAKPKAASVKGKPGLLAYFPFEKRLTYNYEWTDSNIYKAERYPDESGNDYFIGDYRAGVDGRYLVGLIGNNGARGKCLVPNTLNPIVNARHDLYFVNDWLGIDKDPSGYLLSPQPLEGLTDPESFSFSFWFKPSSVTTGNSLDVWLFFQTDITGSTQYYQDEYIEVQIYGDIGFGYYISIEERVQNHRTVPHPTPGYLNQSVKEYYMDDPAVLDSGWHNLVVVGASGDTIVYFDGTEASTVFDNEDVYWIDDVTKFTGNVARLWTCSSDLPDGWSTTPYFELQAEYAHFDELSVWDKALTAEEVAALVNTAALRVHGGDADSIRNGFAHLARFT